MLTKYNKCYVPSYRDDFFTSTVFLCDAIILRAVPQFFFRLPMFEPSPINAVFFVDMLS